MSKAFIYCAEGKPYLVHKDEKTLTTCNSDLVLELLNGKIIGECEINDDFELNNAKLFFKPIDYFHEYHISVRDPKYPPKNYCRSKDGNYIICMNSARCMELFNTGKGVLKKRR